MPIPLYDDFGHHATQWVTPAQMTEHCTYLNSRGFTGIVLSFADPFSPNTPLRQAGVNGLTPILDSTSTNFTLRPAYANYIRSLVDAAGAAGLSVALQTFGANNNWIGTSSDSGVLRVQNAYQAGVQLASYFQSASNLTHLIHGWDTAVNRTWEDDIWEAVRAGWDGTIIPPPTPGDEIRFWGTYAYWDYTQSQYDILPDANVGPYQSLHGDFNCVLINAGPTFGHTQASFDEKMSYLQDRGVKVFVSATSAAQQILPDFTGPSSTKLNLPGMNAALKAFVTAGIDLTYWYDQGVLLGIYLLDDIGATAIWGTGDRGWNIPYPGYSQAADTTHYGIPGYERTDLDLTSFYGTGWGLPPDALDEVASYVHLDPDTGADRYPTVPAYHRAHAFHFPPLAGGYQHVAGGWNHLDLNTNLITNAQQYKHMLPIYPTKQYHSLRWLTEWDMKASDFHGFARNMNVWAMAVQHGGRPNNTAWSPSPGPGWDSHPGYAAGLMPTTHTLPFTGASDNPTGFPNTADWVGGSNQGRLFMRPSEIAEVIAWANQLESVDPNDSSDQGIRLMTFRFDVEDWYEDRLLYYLQRDFGTENGLAKYYEWHAAMKAGSDYYLGL